MNKSVEQSQPSAQTPEPIEPAHRGAFLKKERESRGISIETVHEATKIPLDSLRAIEEDYKIRTMTEFYYNSFLKIYARYLGVDISRVADQSKPVVKPRTSYQQKEISFDLTFLEKFKRSLTRERKRQIFFVLAAILGLWLLVKFIGFLANRPSKPTSSIPSESSRPDAGHSQGEAIDEGGASLPDAVTATAQPAVVPTEATENVSAPISGKSIVLTVRAKKESWLRVKADGNIVFQSTLSSGGVETWDAGENIEITGRNLGELEFELNGKMIGPLGRASRRAKALVVTKDGLSVTK